VKTEYWKAQAVPWFFLARLKESNYVLRKAFTSTNFVNHVEVRNDLQRWDETMGKVWLGTSLV